MDVNDKYIILQVRNRNKDAFKFLFEAYYEDLVQFAEKMLFDIMSREDLVKDLFLYLWENAADIDIKISLRPYLYRSVKNRCLNRLKKVDIKTAIVSVR